MTINSQKKNWDLFKKCQKHALKLSWNSCIWHALGDQTFYGQKTNLHEQSPTGRELVTNAWLVWFLLFITQVNLSNIVMWETLHNVSHIAASCPTAPSSSASSSPDTQSTQSARLESHSTNFRETCRWRLKSKWRSVKFSSVANSCKDERTCEETSLLQERSRIRLFKNVQGNLPQKIPTSTTRTTRSGRTITAYLVLTFHTSRKTTWTCDNNSNASQKTKWRTSIWNRWYGECLWLSLNKPRFILETIIWRIYIQPKISHKEQRNNCACDQKVGQKSEWNSRSYPCSTGKKFLGKCRLCWLTVQFGCQHREAVCTLQFNIVHGKISENPRKGMEGENRLVYELSRTGSNRRGVDGWKIFLRIHYIAESRRNPEHDDWNTLWTWAIPRTDHLHVNVQRHCMSRKKETKTCVLRIPKSKQNMQEDSRTDIGRFLGMDQKRNGTELTRANRMENEMVSLRTWCSTSVKVDIPHSVDPVLWNEEIWRSKVKDKLSIHFCGDDKTVEVVLRTIISVNQLSIYGAVADMCDELACRISGCAESTGKLVAQNNSETMVMPTELSTTNKTPRTNDKVQGNLHAAR